MPRFAILTHDWPHPHWDLLLEKEAMLRAWRLGTRPDTAAAQAAEALPDHRRQYLDYEGPISGNRGTVAQWDTGTFDVVESEPERLRIELHGRRLRGQVVISSRCGDWTYEFLSEVSPTAGEG